MKLVLNVFGHDIASLSWHAHATELGEKTVANGMEQAAQRFVQATTHQWMRFMVPKRRRL